jgi:hypothetical protein
MFLSNKIYSLLLSLPIGLFPEFINPRTCSQSAAFAIPQEEEETWRVS